MAARPSTPRVHDEILFAKFMKHVRLGEATHPGEQFIFIEAIHDIDMDDWTFLSKPSEERRAAFRKKFAKTALDGEPKVITRDELANVLRLAQDTPSGRDFYRYIFTAMRFLARARRSFYLSEERRVLTLKTSPSFFGMIWQLINGPPIRHTHHYLLVVSPQERSLLKEMEEVERECTVPPPLPTPMPSDEVDDAHVEAVDDLSASTESTEIEEGDDAASSSTDKTMIM
jgi:hypothetical protein